MCCVIESQSPITMDFTFNKNKFEWKFKEYLKSFQKTVHSKGFPSAIESHKSI